VANSLNPRIIKSAVHSLGQAQLRNRLRVRIASHFRLFSHVLAKLAKHRLARFAHAHQVAIARPVNNHMHPRASDFAATW
jgi:hypothetical protein